MQFRYHKIQAMFVLCISLVCLTGCSLEKNADASHGNLSTQKETAMTSTNESPPETSGENTDKDEDMASSPIDFNKLTTVSKQEENSISYYPIETTKEYPLPLNEWAKLDIQTENGGAAAAYIRFTDFTKDATQIDEYLAQYTKTNNLPAAFQPLPVISDDEYVLMNYEILIGKDAPSRDDSLSYSAIRFPLQLFSSMRSGAFGGSTVPERENLVTDVSILDISKPLEFGATVEKTVLCSVPKENTAYGIRVPYISAEGATHTIYFKLEY